MNLPPSRLWSRERAKSEAVAAGAIARVRETRLWHKPIVVPNAFLVGAALVMKMFAQPNGRAGT
jgi:hypothetical protein